jgi:hypothetical protein
MCAGPAKGVVPIAIGDGLALIFFRNPGGLPICISEGVLWTRQKEYKVISE